MRARESIAAPVTFAFEGVVNSISDPIGALGDDPGDITTFRGSYTFESTTPNTDNSDPFAAYYDHRQPPAGFRVDIGPLTVRPDADQVGFRISVFDEWGFSGQDEYHAQSLGNQILGAEVPIDFSEVSWFVGTMAEPFNDVSLPTTPLDLDVFGGGSFVIAGECAVCPESMFTIRGELTSLTLVESMPGDLNGDGVVNRADAAILAGEFGVVSGEAAADLDGNGFVGLGDVILLQQLLSPAAAPSAAAVPEPRAIALGGIAAAVLAVRRWRRGRVRIR